MEILPLEPGNLSFGAGHCCCPGAAKGWIFLHAVSQAFSLHLCLCLLPLLYCLYRIQEARALCGSAGMEYEHLLPFPFLLAVLHLLSHVSPTPLWFPVPLHSLRQPILLASLLAVSLLYCFHSEGRASDLETKIFLITVNVSKPHDPGGVTFMSLGCFRIAIDTLSSQMSILCDGLVDPTLAALFQGLWPVVPCKATSSLGHPRLYHADGICPPKRGIYKE